MLTMGFDAIDMIAFVFFCCAWILHEYIVQHSPLRQRTLSGHMVAYRQRWIENMLLRDPKMVDAIIQNSLQQGVLFFASSSMLLVGALMAGLGAADQAVGVLNALPLTEATSTNEWEIKVLIGMLIFVYAFFKFAWSYRLFNYFTIMIGAAPEPRHPAAPTNHRLIAEHARQLSEVHKFAARHFTSGVNAYFQALAVLSWFVSPWLFMASSTWVFLVLYRRAFHSRTLKLLAASPLNPNRDSGLDS